MSISSKSLSGIKGSNFEIRLEYNENHMIVHLPRVDVMSKGTLIEMKYLLSDWLEFFNLVGYPAIYAAVEPNSKAEKLAKILKFYYISESENMNIYLYKE